MYSNSECNPDAAACNDRSTLEPDDLFRRQRNPDSERSDQLQLEPSDGPECNQYSEPHSEPDGNHELHGNGNNRRLHTELNRSSYGKTNPCNQRNTT
jgi:hypothetical protein